MTGWVPPVALAMARGLLVTAELATLSAAAGIAAGLLLGVGLASGPGAVKKLIRLHVELWRGLPLIVILFFAFFALPAAGVKLTGFAAACVGLSLWASAVCADNVRGAIQSIPPGQFDAARALGLGWGAMMARVILPQATRRLLPPTVNLLTSLIHGTSLAAQLGVLELLEAARRASQRLVLDVGDSHSLAIIGGVLVAYYAVCSPLTVLSRRLERRLRV